jgi:cytoskeleton protein RodZ
MTTHDDKGDVLPLVELGLRLRKARLSKRWTLEKLSEKTRVSVRQIDNIERGNFKAIPSRTLVLGFTTSICQALKIKPEPILLVIKRELYDEGNVTSDISETEITKTKRWFQFWR